MRRHLTHLVLLIVATVAGAACAVEIEAGANLATGRFERTLAVSGPVDLDVRTGSGAVVVRQGVDGQVHVKGEIRARRGLLSSGPDAVELVATVEADPPIAQEGNVIRLGTAAERELRGVSISYELIVPAETTLRARTGSGRIDVDSVNGPVDAHTGSGSVLLGRIAGAAVAETGSGAIEVLGADNGVTARTGSGSILGRDLAGPVRAGTGSGRIDLSYAADGDADVRTGSGSIRVHGVQGGLRAHTGSGSISIDGAPTAAWHVETGSGSLTLTLPADAAFELDARSGSGSIRTSHPLVVSGASQRNRLRGTARGGGPQLALQTGSGSIRVE